MGSLEASLHSPELGLGHDQHSSSSQVNGGSGSINLGSDSDHVDPVNHGVVG